MNALEKKYTEKLKRYNEYLKSHSHITSLTSETFESEITELEKQIEEEEKTYSDEEIKAWLKTRPDLMSYTATPYFVCCEFRDKLLNK